MKHEFSGCLAPPKPSLSKKAVFADGVYKPRASQQTRPFYNVERLELPRGPQGTLYGRDTFAGCNPGEDDKTGLRATALWNVSDRTEVIARYRLDVFERTASIWNLEMVNI